MLRNDQSWESLEQDYNKQFNSSKINLNTAAFDRDQLRLLMRDNGEFFIETMIGDQLDYPVPELHTDIWKLLTTTALERVLLAIPRDHAKTTLAKLAVCWYFAFTDFRFCVYLSNTNGIALNACKDIYAFFKHENFVAIFGHIKPVKESETASLWIFDFPLPDGSYKRCILRAAGANQQMRGINIDNIRPDFAVVDDVEDNDNTATPLMQKKLDRWIFGPFLKALSRRRRKIIWLGNMLSKTSLLARLSKNPDWNPVVFGALIKDHETGGMKSLWPDRWPLEELIKDFKEYQSMDLIETWMCEMMNMPGFGRNGFSQEDIYYQPVPSPNSVTAAFLTLDPAFGEEKHNDNSAICVHVIREDGLPMVAEDVVGKMSEDEIFNHMLRLSIKWNAWIWGIEAVAAQKVLITLFNLKLTLAGIMKPVTMLPLISGKGDPKIGRIKAFAGLMKEQQYAIYEGAVEITTELLSYDMTKKSNHDDAIDSAAYGPIVLADYNNLIYASRFSNFNPDREPRFGMEVLNV